MNEIINVTYKANKEVRVKTSLYQWDRGVKLRITGIDLPENYEVHFSNQQFSGDAKVAIGDASGVVIPDEYTSTGRTIYAWLVLQDDPTNEKSMFTVVIPVIKRPMPEDEELTPSQRTYIDEAIAAMNEAVSDAQQAIEHYPRVNNGVWQVWDVENEEYVSTGVQAQGPQGETGATGATGNGIASVAKTSTSGNIDTYTVTFTNGTTTTFNVTNSMSNIIVASGEYDFGNISAGSDSNTTITIGKTMPNANYMVVANPLTGRVAAGIQEKTTTTFKIFVRNNTDEVANAKVRWAVIADNSGFDAGGIAYSDSASYASGTVGAEVSDLKSVTKTICESLNLYIPQSAEGVSIADSNANKILTPITLEAGHSYTYSIRYTTASNKVSYVYLIDKNINVISSFTVNAGTTEKSQTFTANANVNNCAIAINTSGNALNYIVSFVDNNAPTEPFIEELQGDIVNVNSEIVELYDRHLRIENIGTTANLEMTSTQLVKPADDQPKRITIWFPVVQGRKYTVDKKYSTQYFRIGYTAVTPANGVSISNYEVLSSMTNYISFVAVQSGYACMKIYDASVDTTSYSDVLAACVAYEGNYNSTVTQSSEKVVNLAGTVFHCGSTRELNTLKAGIEEATKYMDSVLYVDDGVYDLIEEFGSAWFEALTSLNTMSGLVLKNRIHVVFSPNSKVISHYTGNNQYALSLYSPFNAGEYGFTIENLNLDCSRCRYAVHDERNGNTEQYKAHYINCKMKIDNSNNSAWTAKHCIGGGLGTNAEIVIENSLFESDDSSTRYGVYYHIPNVATDDYRSVVVIKDNYFVTGCITLDDVAGTPSSDSDNSEYMITNNSFPIKYDGTNEQGIFNALAKSYNIRAWGNSFRN